MKFLIYLCSVLSHSTEFKEIPLNTILYIDNKTAYCYVYPLEYRTWEITHNKLEIGSKYLHGYIYMKHGPDRAVIYIKSDRVIGVFTIHIDSIRVIETIEYKICKR